MNLQQNFELLEKRPWPFNEIKRVYGISLNESPQSLLAQYCIWATRYQDHPTVFVLDLPQQIINRSLFELFLSERGLTSLRNGALTLGMDEDTMLNVMTSAYDKNLISKFEMEGEFLGVRRIQFFRDFHKRLPNYRGGIHGTYDAFVRKLHEEIRRYLDITIEPIFCSTSLRLEEEELKYGHDFDCLTEEPVSLPYQFTLLTLKPIRLQPDLVSLATIADNFLYLKDKIAGSRLEIYQEQFDKLRDK